jgi:periplasmic protein TonB
MVSERRRYLRVRVESLTSVNLGPDNGGIVVNASEGGLRVRLVGPVKLTELLPIGMTLHGKGDRFEASGQIAWTDDSGRAAGLEFIQLKNESRQQIRRWIALSDSTGSALPEATPAPPATPLKEPSSSEEHLVSTTVASSTLGPTVEEPLPPPEEAQRFDPVLSERATSAADQPYEPWNTYQLSSETQSALSPREELREPWRKKYGTPDQAAKVGWQQVVRRFIPVVLAGLLVGAWVVFMLSNPGGLRQTFVGLRTMVTAALWPSEEAVQPAAPVEAQPGPLRAPRRRGTAKVRRGPVAVPHSSSPGTAALLDEAKPPSKTPSGWHIHVIEQNNEKRSVRLRGGPIIRLREWATSGEPRASSDARPTMTASAQAPAPAAASEAPVTADAPPVSGGLRESRPMPDYPPLALEKNLQGRVVLRALIGRDGSIQDVQLLSGPPLLASAVLDAVRRWHYTPFYRNGQPVEMPTQITVEFTIKTK